MVFVPHDWMHATFNEADSVAVAQVHIYDPSVRHHCATRATLTTHFSPLCHVPIQEFCTLRHTNLRFNPLGYIIYGGNDAFRGLGRPNTYIPGKDQVKKVNMNQMSGSLAFPGIHEL